MCCRDVACYVSVGGASDPPRTASVSAGKGRPSKLRLYDLFNRGPSPLLVRDASSPYNSVVGKDIEKWSFS